MSGKCHFDSLYMNNVCIVDEQITRLYYPLSILSSPAKNEGFFYLFMIQLRSMKIKRYKYYLSIKSQIIKKKELDERATDLFII